MDPNGIHALLTCCLIMSMANMLNSSPHPQPIANGKAAKNNRFPFAVAFSYKRESSFSFFCGGTLVTQSSRSSWAISASHCFLDSNNRTVYSRVGGGNLVGDDAEWRKVLAIVSAALNIYTLQNDIALVQIVIGHQQVTKVAIRLAKQMPSNRARCLIYGYGSLSYLNSSVYSNTLRYGLVDTISFEKCEEILGRVTAPSQGTGQFCALGRNGADACNGDSGSGLICRGAEGRFELVGITSHGMGCGDGTAGVYESVVHHKGWIESVLLRHKVEKRLLR